MLHTRLLVTPVAILAACSVAAAEQGLLLHYAFDEGQGSVVADASGNGLHGTVAAEWAASPSGKAVQLDGTPTRVVRVQLPEARCFGTGSWTFSAWLNPTQLTIEDAQNQRRVFAFGLYPAAYLVIDLLGSGQPCYYFCYRDAAGTVVSTGGSAAFKLTKGQWAHVVVACDREARQVTCYVNGYSQGATDMAAGFAGDFKLGGELTLGNGWHNYWGLMDEVRVYRRALPKADVKAEFERLKGVFGAVESPAAAAAERREALQDAFRAASRAWAARDYAGVRTACAAAAAAPEAPAHFRSYARLRTAQSYLAEGKAAEAKAEYARLEAGAEYPEVHRAEARECLAEIDRASRGLPARDPAASRTRVPAIATFAAEVVVAPDGNDAADGSAAKPVASLAAARDRVRALKAKGVTGPVLVRVRAGEYPVEETLELSAVDSGSEQAPVVYRAEPPGQARFYGGARLKEFVPVSDAAVLARLPEAARGRVMRCDLKALGIEDYGDLQVRGFSQPPSPPTLELFVNDRPMTLARWPNTGFVHIGKLVEPGSKPAGKPSVFEYLDDRHARWTQAEDAWLFGYFRYLWADATIKVGKIDPAARTVTTAEAYHYGEPGMHPGQGIQYYAFNLLEEIDQPGEWYLDRGAGVLYLYPPVDLAGATVEIGLLATPMITMRSVTDVRLEGLVFDLGRYNGLTLEECSRCWLAGCTVSRLAGNGITVAGGEANVLLGCDVHTIGRRATEVIGGDRATLKPGRHVVENCRIHDFGRIDRTYTPAIQLEGVGNRVAHNLMYDGPSSVMRIEGNDHVMEFNEVHSAVRESDDQGAMELFMNATYRGVVFRYNRFSNCGKTGSEAAVHGQAAIRLDDAISGILIYGNIFVRSANGNFGAVQMNSGRDNVMDNNLFVDCKQGVSGGWNPGNSVWRMLADGKPHDNFFVTPLYLSRYPDIAHMLEEPGINHVWRNVFFRCGPIVTGNRAYLDLFENGVFAEQDPGFADAVAGDFGVRPDAALFQVVGFRPLPAGEIGLYADAYRASWPVAITPVQVPDWRAKP